MSWQWRLKELLGRMKEYHGSQWNTVFPKRGPSGVSFCLGDQYSKCPLTVVTWEASVTLGEVRFIGVMRWQPD